MSRISHCFAELQQSNRKALVTYIIAGDPVKSITVDLMHAMVDAGTSIIELAFPFSDPEAEGPVIQAGHQRAMSQNVSLADTIAMVREFRQTNAHTPVLLMGYVNPIEVMGYERFAELAAVAGVDGTILVNLPPEEGEVPAQIFEKHGIDTVYLLAPTTSLSRAEYICNKSRGFVYYVSVKGVTGASTLNVADVESRVGGFRDICQLPMVVGFGIKDGQAAVAVTSIADGAVVGSALVEIMAEHQNSPEQIIGKVSERIRSIREALDANATG